MRREKLRKMIMQAIRDVATSEKANYQLQGILKSFQNAMNSKKVKSPVGRWWDKPESYSQPKFPAGLEARPGGCMLPEDVARAFAPICRDIVRGELEKAFAKSAEIIQSAAEPLAGDVIVRKEEEREDAIMAHEMSLLMHAHRDWGVRARPGELLLQIELQDVPAVPGPQKRLMRIEATNLLYTDEVPQAGKISRRSVLYTEPPLTPEGDLDMDRLGHEIASRLPGLLRESKSQRQEL